MKDSILLYNFSNRSFHPWKHPSPLGKLIIFVKFGCKFPKSIFRSHFFHFANIAD